MYTTFLFFSKYDHTKNFSFLLNYHLTAMPKVREEVLLLVIILLSLLQLDLRKNKALSLNDLVNKPCHSDHEIYGF